MKKASLTITILLLHLLHHLPFATSIISIDDNAYKGIVIAIHRSTPENLQLIDKIKELFTTSSLFLHKATRQRAYFGEITIVVPSSWSIKQIYEPVQSGDQFTTAHIRVHDEKHPAYGDAPYTQQPGGCGEQGEYIHLTSDYLLNTDVSSQFGNPEKTLVHEWGHLRYGLFDEHGDRSTPQTPLFFKDENGNSKHTGCVENIRGWLRDFSGSVCKLDPKTGKPDVNCDFYPDVDHANNTASLMDLHYLPSVSEFCDDDNHNPSAPTKHNLMCGSKSSWTVMNGHEDFKGRNEPRTVRSTTPTFRLVQPKDNNNPTIVMVLDTSASMRGHRMQLLHEAATRFIQYQVPLNSTLGIVTFATNAKRLTPLTIVYSDRERQVLTDRVPRDDDNGNTAIGKGILEGIQLLIDSREPTEGALLLLVSDGEENVQPLVKNILNQILQSKVVINTIALGNQASDFLERLIIMTNGRGFFYDDSDQQRSHKDLIAAFRECATTQADIELNPVDLVSMAEPLGPLKEIRQHFYVDKEVGKDTIFSISYDYPSQSDVTVEVTLVSPSGKQIDSSYSGYKEDLMQTTVFIEIADAEAGNWTYTVRNKVNAEQDISIIVTSKPLDLSQQPIRIKSWVSDLDVRYPEVPKIFAEVRKGYGAIVDASVIARVFRPVGEPHIIMLKDKGQGADATEDDGIYSGYFTQFNGSGRYSLEAVVLNDGRAQLKIPIASGSQRIRKLPTVPEEPSKTEFTTDDLDQNVDDDSAHTPAPIVETIPVEFFQRSSTTGAFKVSDWQPQQQDLIPPARITDLNAFIHSASEDDDNLVLTLSWTSTGDDMDYGQSSETLIYSSDNATALLQNHQDETAITSDYLLSGSTQSPKPSGVKDSIVINLQKLLEQLDQDIDRHLVLYFLLTSKDKAGNTAEVSNLARTEYFKYDRVDPYQMDAIIFALLLIVLIFLLLFALWAVVKYVKARGRGTRRYSIAKPDNNQIIYSSVSKI